MDRSFNLTCWYLNNRRINELLGLPSIPTASQEIDQMQEIRVRSKQINALIAWMRQSQIEPLEKQILEERLEVGSFFTHHTNFFFKGLSEVMEAINKNKTVNPAIGYAKLDHWKKGARVTFDFHHEHLTSNSAWSMLAGQRRMLVLGLVQDIQGNKITALPYVIGNIVLNGFTSIEWAENFWGEYREVHINRIDNFSVVKDYNPRFTKQSLQALKDIPEKDIKQAFAEIINEPHIPKDWGGESSDLFSSHVAIEGRQKSTAFIFKGPAEFHPMKMKDLGKNGDQICRLYDEPADLLVLQHCHEITNPVRKTMRAYAQQVGNLRLFCLIDGYDTLRILKAYKKCGLSR